METVSITNRDEVPIKRYGKEFQPGETLEIPISIVQTYSMMEISLNLQYASRRLSSISQTLHHNKYDIAGRERFVQKVQVMNMGPEPVPFLVRKYRTWKLTRALRKKFKNNPPVGLLSPVTK